MQEISSVQNPIIKMATSLHDKKARNESGLFIIEGFKGVEDALNFGLEITHIFLNCSRIEKIKEYPKNLLYMVNDRILKKISTTDSPPDIIAVAKQFNYNINDILTEQNPIIIAIEDIKDPGNLGTIIRTAKAAGISGIILTGETADIFNPKTVRASAANLWKIPIIHLKEKAKLKELLRTDKPFQFISTSLASKNSKTYFEIDYKQPSVIIFGSEATGISSELNNLADINIKIPMNPEIESLNLSVSVGIILYEALRQRKNL
ncbi:MAG TPA: RNA methyltransferase [Candidatus Gastranaerophilales bacterium]|nr:RNA methyltransferase [Candidatus Gastranaerophilales bacterium]